MEGEGHDTIGEVEGLLDAVAVVDVNVDVEDARVHLEQLEDCQHDVVGVAEAARLALFRVMQATRPVDHDVGAALVDARGAGNGTAGVGLAVLEEAVEDRAVLANVVPVEHRAVL